MAIDPYAHCNYNITAGEVCTLKTCCLAQSNFLYLPSLGGNVFFAAYFGIICFPQLWLAARYRTWGFATGMLIGLMLEVVGYAGRIILHFNPFNGNGFLIYLICLTIAPVFISAAIYLTIARITCLYGQHLSYLKPRTIALVFMTSDFTSLVLQAAGGAIADTSDSSNSTNSGGQQTGINIMIAGLFLQAVSLAVFFFYITLFWIRCRNGVLDGDPAKAACRSRKTFKIFIAALLLATLAILVRSIFRVAELWEGFSGSLWNDQTDFMILDGGMVSLAALLLTAFHPGPAFLEQWHAANWSFSSKPKPSKYGSQKIGSPDSPSTELRRLHT